MTPSKDEVLKLAKQFGELYEQANSDDLIDFANAIAEKARDDQIEKICAAIKAEDDHCADGDYMMDSNDCIEVVRGTWKRPEWASDAIRANKG